MILFGFDIRGAGFGPPVMKIQRRYAAPMSPVSPSRGGWLPVVREPFTGAWQRNQEVRAETVMAHHAVYACATRILQDVGKLRPKLVELDEENGIWSETKSPAFSRVLSRPNHFQNHIQFKEWWLASRLMHGNAYVLLERDDRGVPRAEYVLDPCRVTVLVASDGAVFYQLKADNLAGLTKDEVAVPASEIIHDRMNCLYHPLVGTSPIYACATAANMGLEAERNSSAFFAGGSNPSGILSTVQSITKQKAMELAEIWESQYAGANSGRVAVLGDGMKFEGMRMTAIDSQLIEHLEWTASTVCAAFHVPAWKIGVGQMPAYTNPEVANQTYYSDCLQTHIEAWELCQDEAFNLTTKTEGRWLGVELDLDGLMRMDTATQVETLTKGVRGGVYTPNEARRKVDLEPLEGGGTIYMQHQDYPIEKVFNRSDLDPAPAPAPIPPPAPAPPAEDASAASERANKLVRSLAFTIRAGARTMRLAA